jgi:isopentenyldiphosphate isomerase
MDDELLDLVNKNDEVIGTINRKDYKQMLADNIGYIRASDLFIMNSKGKLYIPIRTANKTIAPNGFDYSVGGHVGAGDDYMQTIIREAQEELNLDINEQQIELIGKDVSDDIKYIRSIYLLRSDDTPTLNPNDFVSGEWLTPDEIISKIDAGHPTKINLKDTLLLLKNYLTAN